MFVFEVLLVGLGVGHLRFTHRTGEHERLLGGFHLVAQSVSLLFLHFGCLFLSLLLRLDLLVSTGHFSLLVRKGREKTCQIRGTLGMTNIRIFLGIIHIKTKLYIIYLPIAYVYL